MIRTKKNFKNASMGKQLPFARAMALTRTAKDVAMTIAEVEGLASFSLFEKLGTTGIVAAGAYLIIRWLLGERQKDRDRLDEMHQARYEELKEILEKVLKDK